MERTKEAGRQIIAGGSAGLVEVCIMHPLDLVKTRLQLGKSHYASLSDVFQRTYKAEGVGGFYKGILPPILAETPKRATKFFTFEQYKTMFTTDQLPTWFCLSMAGLCSGLTEAVVICPFEVVKVRLQSDKTTDIKLQKSTATVAREIIKTHGMFGKGLYCGFNATLYRHGVWNMFYFGIYHNLKPLIPDEKTNKAGNISLRLFLGFLAGTFASIANIPFDVAKSRIQSLPYDHPQQRYHGTWQAISLIKKEEGTAALYRGLVPKVMRLGPGGGIMLLVFEKVYEWLKIHT